MTASRNSGCTKEFLLNEVDRFGRPIAPEVFSVALEIAPRLIAHAQNMIGDSAVAATSLEEAAAAISAAIKEKQRTGAPPVRDIGAYLFRAFIRIIDREEQKEAQLDQSIQELGETHGAQAEQGRVEAAILINEIMSTCDRASRQIILLRLREYSWQEIGERFGISASAAEARYHKALDRARKKLRIRR